jgi:hypothetical protein
VVEWQSITVAPYKGGTREVVVDVADPDNGAQLRAEAEAILLSGGNPTAAQRARAAAQTPVGMTDLELVVTVPELADQEDSVNVEVEVTNTSTSSTIDDISTRVRLPQHIEPFYTSVLADAATCTGTYDYYCQPGETLTFAAISLAPLESKTFTIPPSIADDAPLGSLLGFAAEVVNAGGRLPLPRATGTVRVCSGSGCE